MHPECPLLRGNVVRVAEWSKRIVDQIKADGQRRPKTGSPESPKMSEKSKNGQKQVTKRRTDQSAFLLLILFGHCPVVI